MKKFRLLITIPSLVILFGGCNQSSDKETLLNAKPHTEDSIIYKVPKSPRLCDNMNIEKKYINIGDCKLYCEIEGVGIPLVLINGGPGGTHHCFHPWLSEAKDRFKLIYYDQRGCGLSDYNSGEGYSFEQTVDDLEKLRIALNIDKWIVLGHSFGGGIAQYYTIKYPKSVLGLILVGSVPMINNPELKSRNENWALSDIEKSKIDEILKLTLSGKLSYAQYFYNDAINGGWKRENFNKPTDEKNSQWATQDIVFDHSFTSDYESYNLEHAFESCPIPTLICEGKYDSLWSSKKVPMMLKNHPNAKFTSFEHSSHNIYSDEPKLFINVISDWSDSLKNVDSEKIGIWENITNAILGESLELINNSKTFVKLIKVNGITAAIKYYENFKVYNPEKKLFLENSLIQLGYEFLRGKKIDQAIETFKLNIKEYPNSFNAYDSLGEAYMKAGNKELAVENYKKSLELNPKNTNAEKMLETLK